MREYGHEFKLLREERNISISQLAKRAKISKSTLSRFESGETQLGIDKFILALETLGLTLAEFENGEINPSKREYSLLEDAKDLYEEQYLEELEQLQTFYKSKDSNSIFNYFNQVTDKSDQSKLLKLLAKQMLSDLSLHFELPKEDKIIIEEYFTSRLDWTNFDKVIFESFKFNQSDFNDIVLGLPNKLFASNLLSTKLIEEIDNKELKKAREIAETIKELTKM